MEVEKEEEEEEIMDVNRLYHSIKIKIYIANETIYFFVLFFRKGKLMYIPCISLTRTHTYVQTNTQTNIHTE